MALAAEQTLRVQRFRRPRLLDAARRENTPRPSIQYYRHTGSGANKIDYNIDIICLLRRRENAGWKEKGVQLQGSVSISSFFYFIQQNEPCLSFHIDLRANAHMKDRSLICALAHMSNIFQTHQTHASERRKQSTRQTDLQSGHRRYHHPAFCRCEPAVVNGRQSNCAAPLLSG